MTQLLMPLSSRKHSKTSAMGILLRKWGNIPVNAIIVKSKLIQACCGVKVYDVENYGRRLRDLRAEGSIDYEPVGKGKIRKLK